MATNCRLHGEAALRHSETNKELNTEEKLKLVSRVLAGESYLEVAIDAGIPESPLRNWVRRYKTLGSNGLAEMRKGRPSKKQQMKKKEVPKPLTESEREERAAQLKAKKQQSSKSSVTKVTN